METKLTDKTLGNLNQRQGLKLGYYFLSTIKTDRNFTNSNASLNNHSLCKDDFIKPREIIGFINQDKVAMYCCDYDKDHYNKNLFNIFGIPFPVSLAKAVPKRQAEFLAGRYTAVKALHHLGVSVIDVPIGKHRCPTWPMGVKGSITHTGSTALSVVGLSNDITYLGVDRENWIKPETVKQVKEIVIQKSEEIRIQDCFTNFNQGLTLTFSAKECLFKALYPSTGFYFDFMAAEITDISLERGKFELTLIQDLTNELVSGARFEGQFIIEKNGVTALISI